MRVSLFFLSRILATHWHQLLIGEDADISKYKMNLVIYTLSVIGSRRNSVKGVSLWCFCFSMEELSIYAGGLHKF